MAGEGRGVHGQSSVEYLLVLVAFIGVLAGLSAIWHAAREGAFFDVISQALSHTSDASFGFELKDIALF